jgi:psp operon transcriptional activator
VPLEAQEKILRVVEYQAFERVGSVEAVEVDVRIVAATHADLPGLCAAGRFRPDLLDRLSFEVLRLPPLRERRGDVLLLARHFAAEMAREIGRPHIPEFAPEAAAALERHPWPGNVRELKNVVERAVCRAEGAAVAEIVFDPFPRQALPAAPAAVSAPVAETAARPRTDDPLAVPLKEALRELKDRMTRTALARARHNQRRAAALLGLSYDQFRGLYRSFRKRHPEAE